MTALPDHFPEMPAHMRAGAEARRAELLPTDDRAAVEARIAELAARTGRTLPEGFPDCDLTALVAETTADLRAASAADPALHRHEVVADLVAQQGYTLGTAERQVAAYTDPNAPDYVYMSRADPPTTAEAIADLRADIELSPAVDRAVEEAAAAAYADGFTDGYDGGEVWA